MQQSQLSLRPFRFLKIWGLLDYRETGCRGFSECRNMIERQQKERQNISQIMDLTFNLSTLTHSHTMTPFDAPEKQAFGKHSGKRRNCF